MNNKFFEGMICGCIFTLWIFSICNVTFYGLDYAVSSDMEVIIINLLFFIVSNFIAWVAIKLNLINKLSKISNILIFLFGVVSLFGMFFKQLNEFVTVDYVMPGPTVKIPNIFWLIVLVGVAIRNSNMIKKEKNIVLKLMIGEILSVIILSMVDFILKKSIGNFENALEINKVINEIIQWVCVSGMIIVSIFNKRYINKLGEMKCI